MNQQQIETSSRQALFIFGTLIAALIILTYPIIISSTKSSLSSIAGMDNIAITHQLPQSITVIHKIELDLDGRQLFALQSSIRTLCITACVAISISVIAVCKYVVNPAITGKNYRERERELRERRRGRKASERAHGPRGKDSERQIEDKELQANDSEGSTIALLVDDE